MPVTIKTIAKQCGMDISTVSRALRGDERVKPETRERIRALADALGYRPNLAARSLQSGKTKTIWFVISDLANSFERALAEPASALFNEKKYDMLVALYRHDQRAYQRILTRLGQGVADAAMVVPGNSWQLNDYEELLSKKVPLIFLDRYIEGMNACVVTTANFDSAGQLVDMCLEQGSEEFVVIMADNDTAAKARLRGASAQLEKRGCRYHLIPPEEVDEFKVNCQHDKLAVVANGQDLIRRFLLANKEQLLNRDVVLATYDNWHGEPDPASVVLVCIQDFTRMAEIAVAKLTDALNNPNYSPEMEIVEVPPREIKVITPMF